MKVGDRVQRIGKPKYQGTVVAQPLDAMELELWPAWCVVAWDGGSTSFEDVEHSTKEVAA